MQSTNYIPKKKKKPTTTTTAILHTYVFTPFIYLCSLVLVFI